jgi:hypothetical protein
MTWASIKEDFEYFVNRWHFSVNEDAESKKITFKKVLYACYRSFIGWKPVFKTRMLVQKIFRRHHLSDLEIWETSCYSAREMLRRIKAFKEHERHGYPSEFCSSSDEYGGGEELYVKNLSLGTIVGGGPERWEQELDHIIMALEYVSYIGDYDHDKKGHDWWNKWFGFHPNDELEVNAVTKWTKRTDLEQGISFTGVREDPHDDSYTKHVDYVNFDLIHYANDVVGAGLQKLGFYWQALWD